MHCYHLSCLCIIFFLLQDQQDLHALYLDGTAIVQKFKAALRKYRTKNFFKINAPFLKGINTGIGQVSLNYKTSFCSWPSRMEIAIIVVQIVYIQSTQTLGATATAFAAPIFPKKDLGGAAGKGVVCQISIFHSRFEVFSNLAICLPN